MRKTAGGAGRRGRSLRVLVGVAAVLAALCACKKGGGEPAGPGPAGETRSSATADASEAGAVPPSAKPTEPDVASARVEPPAGAAAPAADAGGAQPPSRLAMTASVSVAILAPDRAAAMVGRGLGPQGETVDGSWTPAAEDVERFLDKLPERLEAGADRRGVEVAARLRERPAGADVPPGRYRAQIVGLTVGGKRFLFANFFCEGGAGGSENWEEDLVMVRDGGTCYFQAWFDVETGEYPRLTINGEG